MNGYSYKHVQFYEEWSEIFLKINDIWQNKKDISQLITWSISLCVVILIHLKLNLITVQAASRQETNDLKELLDVSREYITAVRVKAAITYVH